MLGVSNITNRTDPNSLKSRVFVGNLNTVHMLKSELETIFCKYGAIVGISVHKGYAFVQYSNETSARAAVISEDGKVYYNMALDVTIASEPKNRKRVRPNINVQIPSCHALPDLALPTQQTLSNHLTSNPVISSLQQLGLEGLMGQPNFAQFAAAANSVLANNTTVAAPNYSGLGVMAAAVAAAAAASSTNPNYSTTTTLSSNSSAIPNLLQTRTKYNRPTSTSSISNSSFSSVGNLSSSAKRTRLEGGSLNSNNTNNHTFGQLPSGARGQNLVSLVSATDTAGQFAAGKSVKQKAVNLVKAPESSLQHQQHPVTVPSRSSVIDSKAVKVEPPSRQEIRLPVKSASLTQSTLSAVNHDAPGPSSLSLSTTASANSEDILICGSCRRLFDQVDELISHKMAGCSLGRVTCEACRCRSDEPSDLECAYCGASFHTAWLLMHHCHNDHGLTIYALPSRSSSSTSSSQRVQSPTLSPRPQITELNNTNERLSVDETKMHPLEANHQSCSKQAEDFVEQDNSDWEASADDFNEVAEAPDPTDDRSDEEEEEEVEVEQEKEQEHVIGDANNVFDIKMGLNPTSDKDSNGDSSPPRQQHPHRRPRGEYGHHETVDDEEEDEEYDDEEEQVLIKVTRNE